MLTSGTLVLVLVLVTHCQHPKRKKHQVFDDTNLSSFQTLWLHLMETNHYNTQAEEAAAAEEEEAAVEEEAEVEEEAPAEE